jgi:hypothetical protein
MSAMILGFVGAFALGVWTAPHITHRAEPPAVFVDTSAAGPAAADTTSPKAAATKTSAPRARAAVREPRVALSEPKLHEQLKPVLNRGANMALAAEGFRSAEQFATIAHAAHNTGVPFLLLKHRVLNEGKSVAEAIRESKPTADAAVEAQTARAQARSDIASIAG